MNTKQLAALGLLAGCLVAAFFVIGRTPVGKSVPAAVAQTASSSPRGVGQPSQLDFMDAAPNGPPVAPAEAYRGVATVRGQILAIHQGDFGKAITNATRSARSRFGPDPKDGFRQLILTGYPELTTCTQIHLIHAVQIQPGQIMLDVVVSGDEMMNVPMRYELSKQNGRYLVEGAEKGRPFLARM